MTSELHRPLHITMAQHGDRPVLEQLWTMFRHDMSEFSGTLPDARGRFRQERLDAALDDPGWCAYLLQATDAPVGLVAVRGLGLSVRVISSFFLVRAARRSGYGLAAVEAITAAHPGRWEVAFQGSNHPAVAFWRRAASQVSPGAWSEERRAVPGRPDLPPDRWISFGVR